MSLRSGDFQNPSMSDTSALKRLLFESQLLVMAALKEQISAPDQTTPKKLPAVERETRMTAVRTALAGLLIEGPLEPGHSVLEACAHMSQTNEIKYLAPERCVSRTHGVMHLKTPSRQLDISSDSLVVKEKQNVPDMIASSALQVQEAMVRRGIGLRFADLVDYQRYSRYLTTLFGHLHREPPPGFARCTVTQIVQADKLVWQKLLEDGVQPKRRADGSLPLDDKLIEALESYQVSFALRPLHAKKNTKPDRPTKKINKDPQGTKQNFAKLWKGKIRKRPKEQRPNPRCDPKFWRLVACQMGHPFVTRAIVRAVVKMEPMERLAKGESMCVPSALNRTAFLITIRLE